MLSVSEKDRISKTYGFPEFFKEGEAQASKDLKLTEFADPLNKAYPIHTKSATYLSNAQFWEASLNNPDADVEVGKRLIEAASFWGIQDVVTSNILKKAASDAVVNEVADLPDSSFAYVGEDPRGGKIRLYPMLDAETVKMSADRLMLDRFDLPLDWKRTSAKNILAKSAEFGVSFTDRVDDYLQRAAGVGVSSTQTMAALLVKRANMLNGHKFSKEAKALGQAADMLKTQRSSRALSMKIASILDKIDTEAGLYKQYQHGLELPEEACHAVLPKHVKDELDRYVQLKSGACFRIDDLQPVMDLLTESPVRDAVPAGIQKVAAAMGELDYPNAKDVERLLISAGLQKCKLPIDLRAFD